jgi:hypothetical protein
VLVVQKNICLLLFEEEGRGIYKQHSPLDNWITIGNAYSIM